MPPPPGSFAGMWMTHLSSKRKSINRTSYNTSSVDLAIQLRVEDNKEDGPIHFLDTTVKPEADGKLFTTVYRKPTHTEQYLQWNSHPHLSAKFSVIYTLSYRAQTVCSNTELLHKEKTNLRNVLTQCNYPYKRGCR